jgi:16S rRNA (cytosine967-C5)-methyltransferase
MFLSRRYGENYLKFMKINPRVIATKVLLQVLQDRKSLTSAFTNVDLQHTQMNLVKELCFGVCRWYFRLTALAEGLLDKPLKAKDQDIYILILLGLYQILYLRVPEYAAVVETVEAARILKKVWATKLVNGILRAFLRQRQILLAKVDNTLVGRYAHPEWMTKVILTAWPKNGEAILSANNQHPPLCLRVNQQQMSQAAYLQSLAAAGIEAVGIAEWGVVLAQPQDITQLPGFAAGQFSVQDSAGQFAASLLLLEAGQRVLDACAAPGGKTTHILEMQPNLAEMVVLDKEPARLERVKENIKRLGLKGVLRYQAVDAGQVAAWWDGQLFDRILVDAPCSGTGVIRRHPDIKLLRTPEDIVTLVQQQQLLLKSLWPLLRPGGILLYATCAIFPAENEQVMQAFLLAHADAEEFIIEAEWGVAKQVGRQIITGEQGRDGFYYARVRKAKNPSL